MSRRRCPLYSRLLVISLTALAAGLGAAGPGAAHERLDRYLFVPNRASADVAVIDTARDEVVARISVGRVPHQVIVSARLGKLVASNTADDTISIVALDGYRTVATLRLDAEPEHMELSPDGTLLAVGNIGAGTVSFVSLAENRETARVAGLFQPHNLTFNRDGSLLYVANLGADHVSVVDVARAAVVAEIPVAEPTPLAAKEGTAGAEYQGIINVTATPDRRLGFAAHGEGNTLAVIDLDARKKVRDLALGELPWRAYASADGRTMLVPNNGDKTVSVISTDSLRVIATLPGAADMTGVNGDGAGATAFVISRGENKVVVLDLAAMARAGEIALPGTPETGVTTPDGRKLYIALSDTGKVAVIDVAARKLIKTIDDVGAEPWGATMVGARNYCH
ncbi:MAG: YncE family protein [Kiloniellaceae bacterium]